MEFDLLLANRVKLLVLYCLIVAFMVFAGIVWVLLDKYSSLLCAAVGTVFFFAGSWLFLSIDKLASKAVQITVRTSELLVQNQLTNAAETWSFDAIAYYKFFPPFRGRAILRLTLRTGDKVKLLALDTSITSTTNTNRLVAATNAFEQAWRLYRQGKPH